MTDDAALLRRYAADRSEEAFAEFVRRNLPFVFSAATRRLGGDPHRAADVAQAVFCAAARNAPRLAGHPTVAGWLYTATRHAASDLMRGEDRRRAREQEVYLMQRDLNDDGALADPSALRAVLDPAMDELSEADREVVLLRYFQDRSFPEIGATLGLSADSARKRLDRAIEKLGGLLQRRGIASSGAALATVLATQSAVAVPPALAASITGAALGSGAAATAAVFLSMTKLQVTVASLVAAGAVAGLVFQQHTIASLREAAASPEPRPATLVATGTPPAPTPTRPPAARPAQPVPTALTQASKSILPPSAPSAAPTARQQADMHKRYDPMFRELGFTPAQEEKFIALKLWQFEINHDLQEAVRQNGLNGRSPGVDRLRAKVSEPVKRELRELLGEAGMAVYARFELTSGYRLIYVDPLNAYFARAAVPLSGPQAEKLVDAVIAHERQVQVNPTDISTAGRMDWNGLVKQAESILTPAQLTLLHSYIDQKIKPSPVLQAPSSP
ncbi:MAG: sigma-70 family RNA polymerase sigma factor [Verrucomicrobia bacterium]|nr:sigma-70 family RNA polymerase sigma factor [Verrucomicrobiota bacterium]